VEAIRSCGGDPTPGQDPHAWLAGTEQSRTLGREEARCPLRSSRADLRGSREVKALHTGSRPGRAGPHLAADLLEEMRAAMCEALALPLALDGDLSRQMLLGSVLGVPKGAPFAIALGETAGLHIDGGKVEAWSWGQSEAPNVRPINVLSRPDLLPHLRSLIAGSDCVAEANRLLKPLVRGDLIDQSTWLRLERFAPITAPTAYRSAARLWDASDAARNPTHVANDAIYRRATFAAAAASATLSLLVASSGPPIWLADMAHTFEWEVWTPSHPYVRERSVWFAGVGAHMARAFGTGVVDRYLSVLSQGGAPLKVLDALLGLTAISIDEPLEAASIASSIAKLEGRVIDAADPKERKYTAALFRSVELVLGRDHCNADLDSIQTNLNWSISKHEIAQSGTFERDAGLVYAGSVVQGVCVIRDLLNADPIQFFPQHKKPAAWQSGVRRSFGLSQQQSLRAGEPILRH